MHRYLTYAGVFVGLVLIQVFLIDDISLGIYFHPLIYIGFLIILPLDTKPIGVLLISDLLGLVIDSMT
ncbi:MAG: rod shape-determining protein MreD, partial [Alistipes sp.]|nr:rod shape-determining protein MreD [Alistipes sp.]